MATLLAKAIQFRSLLDQLSKSEFLRLMGTIFDEHRTGLFGSALFNHFVQSANHHNVHDLDYLNSTISTIIRSRKSKPKKIATDNANLDKMPKAIIGHIASWLQQSDYSHFEQANRSIFIGCNAPNMLKALDLRLCVDYSSINLSKFHSLRYLKIDIDKFDQFPLATNGTFTLNQLQALALDNKKRDDCDIEPFLNQHCIQMDQIKKVRFCNFGSFANRGGFNDQKFEKLLTAFPNATILGLTHIHVVNSNIDVGKLKASYPQLTELCVHGGSRAKANEIVNAFGNGLQFLYHSHFPAPETDFSNVNFAKLQEVSLGFPTVKIIGDILSTGTNIKKFSIAAVPSQSGSTSPSAQELGSVIPQIFKLESLQCLQIEVNEQIMKSVLEGIEIGLFESKDTMRRQLKIRIKSRAMSATQVKTIMFNIQRVIHSLHALNEQTPAIIQQFMLIFVFLAIRKAKERTQILEKLKRLTPNVQVHAYRNVFVISNKKCKINGWKEKWQI